MATTRQARFLERLFSNREKETGLREVTTAELYNKPGTSKDRNANRLVTRLCT